MRTRRAREACRGLSKQLVEGAQGTPFSRCVVAAAQAKKAHESWLAAIHPLDRP
jgi:hypothetical protein